MKHINGWHVHGEWLCDKDNNIIKKPLSFWMDYYGLEPTMWKTFQMWKSTVTGKYMDIERNGGYGLAHDQYEEYKDKLFFVGNADLDHPKLRQCPRD